MAQVQSTARERPARERPTRSRAARRAPYITIRVTGVLLAVLALGHFALTHIANDVADTNASFVARRWTSALWVSWDGALLAATLLHAGAGLVAVIRDYRPEPASRRRWLAALAGVVVVLLLVGTATITYSVVGRS